MLYIASEVIGIFPNKSEDCKRFAPHPDTYIFPHISTKKADGEISNMGLPSPKTVAFNAVFNVESNLIINCPLPGTTKGALITGKVPPED